LEEGASSIPTQVGDPTLKPTNSSIEVKVDYTGKGFIYVTYVDKGAVTNSDGSTTTVTSVSSEITDYKQFFSSGNPSIRSFS